MLETPAARTSHQIAEQAGCTYRQLDYWTRNQIIGPSIMTANGSGTARRWSDTDLVIVRVITVLNALGANADVLGQTVVSLRKRGATALATVDRVVVVPTSDYLGVQRVVLNGTADGQPAWVIPLR